ncbi:MAG: hypothetical protein JWR38_226 [Mucilaginibacter sp.]|nr:hypothetical protein [Mucilaginibacter sp.]
MILMYLSSMVPIQTLSAIDIEIFNAELVEKFHQSYQQDKELSDKSDNSFQLNYFLT